MSEEYKTITREELETWGVSPFNDHKITYLLEILTGEYPLEKAREDILSFRVTSNAPKEGEV